MLEHFLVVVSVIGARPGDVREIARGIDVFTIASMESSLSALRTDTKLNSMPLVKTNSWTVMPKESKKGCRISSRFCGLFSIAAAKSPLVLPCIKYLVMSASSLKKIAVRQAVAATQHIFAGI